MSSLLKYLLLHQAKTNAGSVGICLSEVLEKYEADHPKTEDIKVVKKSKKKNEEKVKAPVPEIAMEVVVNDGQKKKKAKKEKKVEVAMEVVETLPKVSVEVVSEGKKKKKSKKEKDEVVMEVIETTKKNKKKKKNGD